MSNSEIREQFLNPPLLLQTALDMLEPEVMFVDLDFGIIYMNRAKRRNFPHVRLGDKCYEVFESYGERCPNCVVHGAMEDGAPRCNPGYTSIRLDGKIRHMNITAAPVIDEEGEPVGAVETVYDITDLRQSHAQLERLNKEYESVIYALSHDLRSPLVSIDGFVRKLARNHLGDEDDGATHCVNRIHANVRMMNDFVKVLLDTSRISTGILCLKSTDLSEVIDDVMAQFRARAEKESIMLVAKGDFPTLPCDRTRVLQVFSNLVGNALAHAGNVENLRIEIGFLKGIFWVRDNGPGIPENFKEQIFEPFFQGTPSDDRHFGMGMNIAYKIVQKHHGDIWIESSPEEGTRVNFTLEPKHGNK